MVSAKGRDKVTDGGGKGKRKSTGGGDDDKIGRKRKNRGVIQFFNDEAIVGKIESEMRCELIWSVDTVAYLEDEFGSGFKFKSVRRVRVRGGNVEWRALRLDTVDVAPFKKWYLQHYGVEIGRKKKIVARKNGDETEAAAAAEEAKKRNHVKRKIEK
ncbi:40S ribosomal protein s8 [Phtheirospermum japonicum]|uniref:40S ribosomal protein s8 n=1 Tax=Phtheirospermum japonicum TaxID=374723 RepID=A0A830DG23_9LAMI|nr:40S ribosomal protein s8 [Phtheirospermum japonicum]